MIYMRNKNLDGKTSIMPFDGKESFITYCGHCGEDILLADDEFYNLMQNGMIYNTTLYCGNECRRKGKPAEADQGTD